MADLDGADTATQLASATKRLRRMSLMAMQQLDIPAPADANPDTNVLGAAGDVISAPPSLTPVGELAGDDPGATEGDATHVCLFDFAAAGGGELGVTRGDLLCLLDDSNDEWWSMARADDASDTGFVPAAFLCELPANLAVRPYFTEAVCTFEAAAHGELSVDAGASVLVVCPMDEGWVFAESGGETGLVPEAFLAAPGTTVDGADEPTPPGGAHDDAPATDSSERAAADAGLGSTDRPRSRSWSDSSHDSSADSSPSSDDEHSGEDDNGSGTDATTKGSVDDAPAPPPVGGRTPLARAPLPPIDTSFGLSSPPATPASGVSSPADQQGAGAESEEEAAARKLAKQQKLRSRVMLEVLTTEITYVKNLTVFSELYVSALERRDAAWKGDFLDRREVAVLLSNFDQMLKLNTQFLQDLRRAVVGDEPRAAASTDLEALLDVNTLPKSPWLPDPATDVGGIFVRYAPRFTIYEHYAENQRRASESLVAIEKLPEAKAFFDDLRRNPRCSGNTIRSYLIMPVQRIPRYRLLAMELLKRTPPEHADVSLLSQASERINEVALKLNAAAREQENADQLKAIEEQFRGVQLDLMLRGRTLVKEGRLIKVCRRANKTFYFHLFNDLLLYSEKSGMLGYKLHRRMNLKECAVEDVDEQSPEFRHAPVNAFKILSSNKSFLACADTAQAKTEWLTALNKCVVETRAASGVDEDAVVANLAPVWIPDRAATSCQICNATFTMTKRRHHCRMCGIICCNPCSKARRGLRNIDLRKPVRVCDRCLQGQSEGRNTMFHVRVQVMAGHQLPYGTAVGKCDPYVKVFCGPQLYGQTPVKKKNVHPRWSGCAYRCLIKQLRSTEIRLEVWDWDLVGDHSFLGQATFPLGDLLALQARATAREEPLVVPLRGHPQSTLKISVELQAPIASIEAADDPALVIKRWEDQLVGDAQDKPAVMAIQALYRAAITHCKLTAAKQHMVAILEEKFELFNSQAAASVATNMKRAGGGNAATQDDGPRVAAFTRLLDSETQFLDSMHLFLSHVVAPLSDVTDGASLSGRRQSMHHLAMGAGGSRRRFSMMGTALSGRSRRDKAAEACLRSGEVAVLWSSLRQIVTLNSNFLRELTELKAEIVSGDGPEDVLFSPVLAEFVPLCAMYTSYQRALHAASASLETAPLDTLLDEIAASPDVEPLCTLRDRRGNAGSTRLSRRSLTEDTTTTTGRALLQTLLAEPLRRLRVYKRAAEELLGATHSTHADFRGLCDMLSAIGGLWRHVEANRTNDEKAARLKKVDECIVDWPSAKLGKLVAPTFRWLVRRGDLLMVTAATPSGTEVHAWLLGDWLVFGSEVRRGAYRFLSKVNVRHSTPHSDDYTRRELLSLSSSPRPQDTSASAADREAPHEPSATAASGAGGGAGAGSSSAGGAAPQKKSPVAGVLDSPSSGHRGAKGKDASAALFVSSPKPSTHTFEEGSFEDAKWCGSCQEFMWGVRRQGVRCSHCGLVVHRRCQPRAGATPCMKTTPDARARRDKAAARQRNAELAFSLTVFLHPPGSSDRADEVGQWLAFVPPCRADHFGWVHDLASCAAHGDAAGDQEAASGAATGGAVGASGAAAASDGGGDGGLGMAMSSIPATASFHSMKGDSLLAATSAIEEEGDSSSDAGDVPAAKPVATTEACLSHRTLSSHSLALSERSHRRSGSGSSQALANIVDEVAAAAPPLVAAVPDLAALADLTSAPQTCVVCHGAFSDAKPKHNCPRCDNAVCESCSLAKVALHGPGTEHVRVCDTCADVFLSASLQGFSI